MSGASFDRLLRWYPAAWTARYGDEFVAFMEDSYGSSKVPFKSKLDIARTGITEYAREFGIGSPGAEASERVRMGALLVLGAWALFFLSGTAFAKYSEHWPSVITNGDRALPTAAFDTVQSAGLVGAFILVVAALLALPSFWRHVRSGGWADIRRPFWRAVAASVAVAVATTALVVWAHHMEPHHVGNTPSHPVIGAAWALLVAIGVLVVTSSLIAITRCVSLSNKVIQLEGALAIVLTVVMAAVLLGVIVWWCAMASDASHFTFSSSTGLFDTSAPLTMAIVVVMMLGGLAIATLGAIRVIRSSRTLLAS